MSYQSPIELIMGEMNTHIESTILEAVQKVGVDIDKDELIRAICYDREQYQKGYNDRDAEIVRCRDCKFARICLDAYKLKHVYKCMSHITEECHDADWFCADGERKDK